MNDIQDTWLEKQSLGDASFEAGAVSLLRRVYAWVDHLESEGVASVDTLTAMWELVEQIEGWCGAKGGNDNAGDVKEVMW